VAAVDDRKPNRADQAGLIEWVFLDVGNVLYNDDPQNFEGYRFVFESIRRRLPDYSFADLLAEREEWAKTGADFILSKIVRRLFPETDPKSIFGPLRERIIETYERNNILNDGAHTVLQQLRSRWRLGIIANQPPQCRDSLIRRGLFDFFEIVAISDELDLHKPDVRLYEWALKQAGCDPARTVMVGDRRDNDIAPAKSVAMRAVLLTWPDCRSRGWNPDDPLAQAYLDSCDRIPLFSAVPVGPDPDATAITLHGLPAAIGKLSDEGK
jgi:HAD superfamily hydrolase (TIGR01509 family)